MKTQTMTVTGREGGPEGGSIDVLRLKKKKKKKSIQTYAKAHQKVKYNLDFTDQ